jgi:hypothetical protein
MPLVFVVNFFVHRFRVQAKNPGLNIALRNQPRDSFGIGVNNLFSVVEQCLIKLPQAFFNRICIRVYDNNQLSLGMTAAILARFPYELSPNPILSASRARRRLPNSYLMSVQPALYQISIDEHLVAGIFYKNDN